MSHDEDVKLLRAAQRGDRWARGCLVTERLGVVRSLAAHYRDLGLPYDDLVQEGSLGLLEAIDEYDPARGTDFDTYARFRVRRAIRNALTEKSRLIRLPKQVVERRRAIERADARLTAACGHVTSARELAAALDLPPAVIREARDLAASPVSLDQSVLPDGSTLETIVADPAAPDPELEAVEREQARIVDAAVAELPERQREILSRHLGLGRTPEEIAQIAAALHLSQQRTRAIERDALSALRDRLESRARVDAEASRRRWRRRSSARAAATDGAALGNPNGSHPGSDGYGKPAREARDPRSALPQTPR